MLARMHEAAVAARLVPVLAGHRAERVVVAEDEHGAVVRRLQRRDLIVRLLNQVPGVTCQNPGGAFYAWPNVTEACRMIGARDSEELRARLLHEAGVAVLADIHFGPRVPDEGQHIRFSYAASNEAIEKGVARMADFIRRNTRSTAAA